MPEQSQLCGQGMRAFLRGMESHTVQHGGKEFLCEEGNESFPSHVALKTCLSHDLWASLSALALWLPKLQLGTSFSLLLNHKLPNGAPTHSNYCHSKILNDKLESSGPLCTYGHSKILNEELENSGPLCTQKWKITGGKNSVKIKCISTWPELLFVTKEQVGGLDKGLKLISSVCRNEMDVD